jgi:hypothetical protein
METLPSGSWLSSSCLSSQVWPVSVFSIRMAENIEVPLGLIARQAGEMLPDAMAKRRGSRKRNWQGQP